MLVLVRGNIDPAMLGRVIEHGLVLDGRLCRFTATISDRPGGLARLAQVIASVGASVKEIEHDRAFAGPDLSAVNVFCTVETADRRQIEELVQQLTAAGDTGHDGGRFSRQHYACCGPSDGFRTGVGCALANHPLAAGEVGVDEAIEGLGRPRMVGW